MAGNRRGWMALLLAAMLLGGAAGADDSDLPLSDVPRPALAAVKTMYPQLKPVSARPAREGDKDGFEIRCAQRTRILKIVVTADGKILCRKQVLEPRQLPSVIRKAIEGRYPRCLIGSVEQVVAQGNALYRVALTTADRKKREMELEPHGKILEDNPRSK